MFCFDYPLGFANILWLFKSTGCYEMYRNAESFSALKCDKTSIEELVKGKRLVTNFLGSKFDKR
jgi:hypothetical protein